MAYTRLGKEGISTVLWKTGDSNVHRMHVNWNTNQHKSCYVSSRAIHYRTCGENGAIISKRLQAACSITQYAGLSKPFFAVYEACLLSVTTGISTEQKLYYIKRVKSIFQQLRRTSGNLTISSPYSTLSRDLIN